MAETLVQEAVNGSNRGHYIPWKVAREMCEGEEAPFPRPWPTSLCEMPGEKAGSVSITVRRCIFRGSLPNQFESANQKAQSIPDRERLGVADGVGTFPHDCRTPLPDAGLEKRSH